ncbi:MAG: CBS domain-containing protein [Myxococcota bacterium]
MRQPVVEIEPETRVGRVMQLAAEMRIHHFPIVRDGALLGVVCTCDLAHARPETGVLQLARRSVATIAPNRPARDAAQLLHDRGVGSVVVTRGTSICGILTRQDLVEDNAEFAHLLESEHCDVCKKQKHLRRTSNGGYLCAACEERAQERRWMGVGASD